LGALAQELRFELVSLLARSGADGLPAGVIAARLGVAPASLSFHFQQLVRAGLVTQRRRSRYVIYAANTQRMDCLLTYLDGRWQSRRLKVEPMDRDKPEGRDDPSIPR
jgi:DNA-binding transcriptional ArsR family regulator